MSSNPTPDYASAHSGEDDLLIQLGELTKTPAMVRAHLQAVIELLDAYRDPEKGHKLGLLGDNDKGLLAAQAFWEVKGDTVFVETFLTAKPEEPDAQERRIEIDLEIVQPNIARGFRWHFLQLWDVLSAEAKETDQVIAWLRKDVLSLPET